MLGTPSSRLSLAAMLAAPLLAAVAAAEDQPQWGRRHTRNMVSVETNLPETFDPATGKNVKWVAALGKRTYATPIVAGGRVLIGTNNQRPRDPRRRGDRGVLMCFNETDGKFCWQLVVPKLADDAYKDWPRVGICSPPTVEGDRIYAVTNRAEVVCLDINGQADGNDGPFRDERKFMVQGNSQPAELIKTDADIIWRFDMPSEAGMWPHDSAHSSILIAGKHLYLNTGNGVDNTHRRIRRPEAPSLIVLDKATGRLVAADGERIGPRIFHCTWSSPALGEVAGRRLVIFGGGDGLVYAFEPVKGDTGPATPPATLKRVWRFDCDPSAPKVNVHKYIGNRTTSPSTIKSTPVFHDGRVYVTVGGDIWWGKRKAWIKCINPSGTGDVTKTAELWSREMSRHCCATPAIHDGLVYITDLGKKVHCLDAVTGKPLWTHETKGEIYAPPLVADEKVYVGTRRGDFRIFAAGRTKKVLATIQLDSPVHGAATAANGVLYVATMTKLYALAKPAKQERGI